MDDPNARLLVDHAVGALRDLAEDVRALGGGQLPELLVAEGLEPALAALVRPLGTVVELTLEQGRYPAPVEAAVYFVVGEAITNALKHAAAGRIDVRVVRDTPGQLTVTVSDDGRGGADPRLGTGLRGLSERVAVLGGLLVVLDGRPAGTVIEAVLPCAA